MNAVLRSILHVDMDAFYAAVEQRDRPELRGKPVVIAHTGPRGVVSTCSYEARVFGVRSAMPTARALQLCPDGIYITPRIEHYAAISAQIFTCFAEVTPEIEGLSLDEAFLDITRSLQLLGPPLQIGAWLKQRILQQTGLNASVGLAHNKLLAKMASELCKPNGLLEITQASAQALLDPLPVGRLYTIGKVAQQRLAEQNIHSIGDLRLASPLRVQRALGNHALQAQAFAAGLDARPVQAERQEKSIGAEQTFAQDLDQLVEIKRVLMTLAERVAARARAQGLIAKVVTLKLRVPPFETMTRQRTLSTATNQTQALYREALSLLEIWWREQSLAESGTGKSLAESGKKKSFAASASESLPRAGRLPKLRLLGLGLNQLGDAGDQDLLTADCSPLPLQLSLFAPPAAEPPAARPAARPEWPERPKPTRSEDQLTDAINQKFGGSSLRRARGLPPRSPDEASKK